MADFGKVGGGKGGKGSRGSRTRNFKSPIRKIGGRKSGGSPDYHCKFEVDQFHVSGARGGTTYGDALLGTFSEIGRRNAGLLQCLTGATAVADVPQLSLLSKISGATSTFQFRLNASTMHGGSNGAAANAHPNARFEVTVDGPSGDGVAWEDYEGRNSFWGASQGQLTFKCEGPSGTGELFSKRFEDGVTCHVKVWFNGDDNKFNNTPRSTP